MTNENELLTILHSLKVGDFVTYKNVTRRTGGILFRVTEVQLPIKKTTQIVTVTAPYDGRFWIIENGASVYRTVIKGQSFQVEESHWLDSSGKKALKAARSGYVRLKPAFEFYSFSNFSLGKNESGFIVPSYDLKYIKHIDTLELLQKFQSFQSFITMFVSHV